MTVPPRSLQETYAPEDVCFGCGQANPKGLQLRSYPASDGIVEATWSPQPHHQAFPGVLNSGIIGTLLDCHSNWTAAHHLMQRLSADRPPTTVTNDYAIRLLRPTPADGPVYLRARVVDSSDQRATVEAELSAGGAVCATCRGTFVVAPPGHPAHDRH